MEIYIITIILLGFAFLRYINKDYFKKNGKFSGTCASNNPFLSENDGKPCGICGKLPEETECKKSSVNLN